MSALAEPELARLLGRQIRSSVIAQMGLWRTATVPFGQISINAVAADFFEGELVPELLAAIRNRDVMRGELCVEITEGVLLEGGDGARLRRELVELKDAGIEIAFDDFGTGFASLSHLCEFPIDRMKVDRSFVLNLPGSARDIEIVRTIGTLAGALGIRLTAEGV